MRKITLLYILILNILNLQSLQAQVRIVSSATQRQQEMLRNVRSQNTKCVYDSTEMLVGTENQDKYIGQNIIVLPQDNNIENGIEPLYKGFFISCEYKGKGLYPKKRIPLPVYKPITRPNRLNVMITGSDYKSLRGKNFKIIGFTTSEDVNYQTHRFMILHDGVDSIYYEYSKNHNYILEGYVIKQQQLHENKSFVRKIFLNNRTCKDFKTGKSIKLIAGSIWKCVDIVIDPGYGSLAYIMKNSNGQTISSLSFNDEFMAKAISDKIKNKFGQYCWQEILCGNVYVGMPISALKLAWGEPYSINKSNHGEQWCYYNQYIYVRNGKVTGFN